MKNRRYDSLRNRLVLPFALLGLIVSALLSGITYGLVADLEAQAIERMLRFEMESFRNRKARNPNALPPSTTLIYGYFLPSSDLPSFVVPAGVERVETYAIKERSYAGLVGDIAGEPYVLFYDRTFIDSNLVQLAWLLVGGILLMTLIATLVGHRLARQVVRPISRLLDEISAKSAAIDRRASAPLSFSAADCAMAEVIDDAIADCAPALSGRPVSILREIRERPIVAVERSLAYVVISNLLRNACAHTREGSITVRLLDDRVEIVDTGIGIAEDRFPEVFERYVKGEESPGSGLGLSIVARVTQMINWKTTIESCAGVGTRVVVRFSAATPGESQAAGVSS